MQRQLAICFTVLFTLFLTGKHFYIKDIISLHGNLKLYVDFFLPFIQEVLFGLFLICNCYSSKRIHGAHIKK